MNNSRIGPVSVAIALVVVAIAAVWFFSGRIKVHCYISKTDGKLTVTAATVGGFSPDLPENYEPLHHSS